MDVMAKCIEVFRAVEPHAMINRAALRMTIKAVLEICAQEAWDQHEDDGDGSEWDSSAIAIAARIRELKL